MSQWVWSEPIGCSGDIQALALTTDAAGNTYVTGRYSGSASFGSTVLNAQGQRDIFIAKYSPSGAALWATSAGGNAEDQGLELTLDDYGNLWATGFFTDTIRILRTSGTAMATGQGNGDIFIVSIDTSTGLAMQLVTAGGGNKDVGTGITTIGGKVYIVGNFQGTCTVGATNLVSVGGQDMLVAAYNPPMGMWIWAVQGGSIQDEEAGGICDDGSHLYLGGQYGLGGMGLGSLLLPVGLDENAFVARMDTNGQAQWLSYVRANSSADIATDLITDGQFVYVMGEMDGANTLTFYSNPDIPVPSSFAGRNFWYAALEKQTGYAEWARLEGGSGNDRAGGIAKLVGGRLAVSGTFESAITLAGTPLAGTNEEIFLLVADTVSGLGQSASASISSGLALCNDIAGYMGCGIMACGDFEPDLQLPPLGTMAPGNLENGFVARCTIGLGLSAASVSPRIDSICLGDTAAFYVSGVFDQISWNYSTDGGATWNAGPSGTSPSIAFSPTVTTIYSLKAVGPCEETHDTCMVVVNANTPVVSVVGLPDTLCVTAAAVGFMANPASTLGTFTFGSGGFSTTGPGMASFDPGVAGAGGPYFAAYKFTDAFGCSDEDTAWVLVADTLALAIMGLDSGYCGGDTASQVLVGSLAPFGAFLASCPCIVPLPNGQATFHPALAPIGVPIPVSYFYDNGCPNSTSTSTTIFVNNLPNMSGLDPQYCVGAGTDTLTATSGPSTIFMGGAWLDSIGPGQAVIHLGLLPAADTTLAFTYLLTTADGCSTITHYSFDVSLPPTAAAGEADTICLGTGTTIGTPAQTGLAYSWSSVPPGFSASIAMPPCNPSVNTTYLLVVTNTAGCQSMDSVQVAVLPAPQVATGADTLLCLGDSVQLYGSASGSGAFSWSGSDGFSSSTLQPVVSPVGTTLYILSASEPSSGCTDSDSVIVSISPPPTPANAGPDLILPEVAAIDLAANWPGSGQGQWTSGNSLLSFSDPSAPNAQVVGLSPGTFSLVWTISNPPCPASVDSMRITVLELVFPTGFSPNGDGVNDRLVFRGLESMPQNKLQVFTRWGSLVFEQEGYANDWDGRRNGQPLVDDTYYYILDIEGIDPITNYLLLQRTPAE